MAFEYDISIDSFPGAASAPREGFARVGCLRPLRTTVTAANYRRQVASVLAQRLVRELAAEA